MVEYSADYSVATIDGYTFRRDKKTGYYLSAKPIGASRKRLHVYVWEKYNGTAPMGYDVHHVDGNKRNNEITNFELLPRSEHMKEHNARLSDEAREARARNVVKYGVPAAKGWHSTEEGLAWHREHGKKTMQKRPYVEYVCMYCGKAFQSKRIYKESEGKFCSNKCKSAYRRQSGIDNATKICQMCGCQFIANKYSAVKYCEACRAKKGYPRGRAKARKE